MLVFVFLKVHWLKTDFEKWRDEDDSDVEESSSKDMQFENVYIILYIIYTSSLLSLIINCALALATLELSFYCFVEICS